MKEPQSKITGILLAGGKSSRMFGDKETGQDKKLDQNKGLIHDKELNHEKDKLCNKGKARDKMMIRDKGMILIGKLMMYQYPLKVLESLCDEILISTCSPMEIEEDYEQVCDKVPGIGPIGGVVTCLEKSSNDLNIILSYDLPLVNRELFTELLKYSEETSSAENVPVRNDETPGSKTILAGIVFQSSHAIQSHPFDMILPAASPGRPEPLCGIYRKGTIPVMQQMIDHEIYAMHKLIPRVNAKIVPVGASDPFYQDHLFKNINTESDLSGLPDNLL